VRIVVAAGLVAVVPALGLAGGAGVKSRLAISVPSAVVSVGDRIDVRVAGTQPKQRLRLVLRLVPLTGTPPVPLGRVVLDHAGRARLVARLPRLRAAVYQVAAVLQGRLVPGHGLLSVRATPPVGFGPIGAPGCAPASPRNQHGTGFEATEVFGTSAGAQYWALSAAQPVSDEATLSDVVGKTTKIIFKMTSGVPRVFYAVAPDGSRVEPAWGPSPHLASNWDRPGAEWGAGFVFAAPGCWEIHAGAPPAVGDIWISVES
jgi:hypothetical protein